MSEPRDRGWPVEPPGITPTGDVDRWALIVGISRYASAGLSLRYAARDAVQLRTTLLEPSAGAFPEDHVLDLVDEQATLANLTKALRTFLKKPAEDDLVLLFFACHGSRDRDRPGDLYLLPYDTDPGDISGTALPMRDLDFALRQTLHSRRIVALVDACHSGGVGDAFAGLRQLGDDAADLNAYLGALSTSRGGVSLMTSAMESESSIEGQQWGEGHGVFTHFLLEGMRGKADRPPYDGVVTVGELFDYVADRVKDATEDRQHPHISAGADRSLVLAVTGSLSAGQHLELASRLADAAELLGEPTCWRGAAVQYGEVMRLRRDAVQEATGVEHALALFRSGDARAAEQALRSRPAGQPGVRRTLGLIQLAQGRQEEARGTLLVPEPAEDWLPVLFSPAVTRGRRVALLVGLDVLDPGAYGGYDGRLRSPSKEVAALWRLLEHDYGFDEQVRLVDGAATTGAIAGALSELMGRSASCEAIVVLLSGHGARVPITDEPGQTEDTTFAAFDGMIRSAEIDALLRRSAAGRTTLIASSAHAGRFARRAADGRYEVLAACDEGQYDMESPASELGAFMEALLPNLVPDADRDRVLKATRRVLHAKRFDMDPQFATADGLPLLVGGSRGGSASRAVAVAGTVLGVTADVEGDALAAIADLVVAGSLPGSAAGPVMLEWWHRGEPGRIAGRAIGPEPGSLALACAVATSAARGVAGALVEPALDRLARLPVVVADADLHGELAWVRSAVAGASASTAGRIRAVLVGLTSLGDGSAGVKSAADGVGAVRSALLAGGADEDRILALLDRDATGAAVRGAIARAGEDGSDHPVLVYWCGPGSLAGLRTFDGQDIDQEEIARRAGPNLTLVGEGIDMGATIGPPGNRPEAPRVTILGARDANRGRLAGSVWHERLDGRPGKARYLPLTIALVEALRRPAELGDLGASTLTTSAGPPVVLAAAGSDVLIADPVVTRTDDLVRRVRDAELLATVGRLRGLLEQRNGIDPEAQLQLGILEAEVGDLDGAVASLGRAVAQFEGDPGGEARARLHLGRVLLASGRDRARAVSECRLAMQLDPGLTAAWFWLGRAIAELVQHETTTEASDAIRTYLLRGAPVGRRAEAMQLLATLAGKAPAGPTVDASAMPADPAA